MRFIPITLALALCASCSKPPPPAPGSDTAQYKAGYAAGRRAERTQICGLIDKHKAGITATLGNARMLLIHTYCVAGL